MHMYIYICSNAAGELDAACGKVPILIVDGGAKIGQSKVGTPRSPMLSNLL